ncbi:PH domain-containing protein [Bacillus sp. NSP9.1]|uniref:PH domain-containing protein n=1 Tax=Bacillus sp. NSP9.1 TaxID=1071078 RepID=UPI0003F98950|nr:PH domain-containing protein [Bacillus sp. NSP9.1]QHZ47988.1 PH domain-containing protein [Bacillus sp. NSP9.1]
MNKSEKLIKHLHPISILYFMMKAGKESLSFIWLYPLLILLIHKQLGSQIPALIIGVFLVIFLMMVLIMIGVLRWRAFTYQIREKSIYIEYGLFIVKKRWVQPDRIQSIDSTVRLYDHLFSTRTLTIELAGGDESSNTLSCISREEEQRIRTVLNAESKSKPIEHGGASMFQLYKKDLILHSLLSPKFGIVLSLLSLGLLKYLDISKETDRSALFTNLSSWFGSNWIIVVMVIIVLLSFALSLLLTFVSDYHFTLKRNSKGELEIEQGLFEKKKRTIDENRIQAILIIEHPLHRLLGFASIKAVVIRNRPNEQSSKTITLLPFVKKEKVCSILETYTGYRKGNHLHMLTKEAKHYYMVLPFIAGCVLAIPLWMFVPGYYHYLAAVLPPGLLCLGTMVYRMIGWHQSRYFFTLQYGSLSRKTALIKRGRIQWASLGQTSVQERKNLASIKLAVASGKENVKFSITHIPIEDATMIYQHALKTS